ncbi:hypothetical protein WJX72_012269 [[Myrmecia] bisecta]|uniref:Large ribosomal subunit protein uL29c n=1 Tax=[Myrmecia] bisecta TaxID=41462 RepID=A0AAW1PE62_9CHLO
MLEFRSLSEEQIVEEVNKAKRELFDLRVKQKTKQEFKPSDFGWHQTKIAQLLTVKREREIEQGITKREARAAEKRTNVQEGFAQF